MSNTGTLGKPVEIHDKDEMEGYSVAVPTRELALGDSKPDTGDTAAPVPPSLRAPGEVAGPVNGANRVQFPANDKQTAGSNTPGAPIPPKLL